MAAESSSSAFRQRQITPDIATFAFVLLAVFSTAVMAVPRPRYPRQAGNSSSLAADFELICDNIMASGTVPVLKYRSRRTGIQVTFAQLDGPVLHGYFAVATEALDDDGLPHTLEHLIFQGSEEYPFKGTLSMLVTRCLAFGINAWATTDHTAYFMETVGNEGFLNILPIFLDHLFYPTNAEPVFATEIHHINGDGEDAGVVYSEMQAKENRDFNVCYRAMLRAMYPVPSGYRSQTGGMLKNLRETTTLEKIRDYHSVFYRPENLNIIVVGQIEPEKVFEAIASIEGKILSKGVKNPYVRPWESPVPPLKNSVDEMHEYPSDSDEGALIFVSWRGPSFVNDANEVYSMYVLLEYLAYSSISPIKKVFVEVDDPLASNAYFYCLQFSESACYIRFVGVPRAKVDFVKPLLMNTLTQLVMGETTFDMQAMKDILQNKILKQDNVLETSPHRTIARSVISDFLYGYTCEHLKTHLNKKLLYERLIEKPEEYWLGLIQQYMINSSSVVIRGIPSIAEAKRLEEEENQRLEARKQALGEEMLKELGDKLEEFKRINEMPPSPELIRSIPVPGVSSIKLHPLKAYNNHINLDNSDEITQRLTTLPFNFQLDDLNSNFVQIIAILDTSTLRPELRPYLSLLKDVIFESSVLRDDTLIPYEEVVRELSADTLSRNAIFGLKLKSDSFSTGVYGSNAAFVMKVEMNKYERGVQLLQDVLFKTKFAADRIKVKAKKLLNSVGKYTRRGLSLLELMKNEITFNKDANHNQQSSLKQKKFLTSLLERLTSEEEKVLSEIEEVRNTIVHQDRITIHMATNVEKLSTYVDPMDPWDDFIEDAETPMEKMLNIIPDHQLLSYEDLGDVTGFLTGVGSVESGFLTQFTHCIKDYKDPDVPALLTAIQYLIQLEGPMWRGIRGKGLAYRYKLILEPTDGTLFVRLERGSQLAAAYEATFNIINSHANGSATWETNLLDSARSSLIFTVIGREAAIADVVQQSLLSYFRGVPHSYNKDLTDKIGAVTMEDVKRVAQKYFIPLLQPSTSTTFVVTHPSKAQDIADKMKKQGHNLEIIESLEDSRFG